MSSTMACMAQPCAVLPIFSCSDQVSGTDFACATIFFSTASLCSSDWRAGPDVRATLSESARMSSWPCSASSSTLLVVRSWL